MSENKWNAEIIAVGTELLLGQIDNTNATWISEQLAKYGISVFFHQVVGDNLDRVRKVFKQASERSNLVIVTGGLGPTDDDLTREALQPIINQEIIIHEETVEKAKEILSKRNRNYTSNNEKQARVFKNAKVFTNDVGIAPGIVVSDKSVYWILLPGVPKEMKHLLGDKILPFLKTELSLDQIIQSKMLRFVGIGEADLATRVDELLKQQSNPTIAPLAQTGEVALRITARASTLYDANQLILETEHKLRDIVGEFHYGEDELNLPEVIIENLVRKNWMISAAESLTGGLFIEGLIQVPGASKACHGGIVSYSRVSKQNLLNIPKDLIEKYGTVSEECANAMVNNVQKITDSDIAISFTGEAGPTSSEGKPAGTVYIGVKVADNEAEVFSFLFHGSRENIRELSVKKGYELIFHEIQKLGDKKR
ncbi:competence/damage-inducible protein A [Bacillaceae bacterium S4-13-58]